VYPERENGQVCVGEDISVATAQFLPRVGIIFISVSGRIDAKKRTCIHSYKEPSISSWIGAAICQKLTLGLLAAAATITLEVVSFRAYSPFPALLPFFKCILEVVFCEGV
jgi:hypothetical protein